MNATETNVALCGLATGALQEVGMRDTRYLAYEKGSRTNGISYKVTYRDTTNPYVDGRTLFYGKTAADITRSLRDMIAGIDETRLASAGRL